MVEGCGWGGHAALLSGHACVWGAGAGTGTPQRSDAVPVAATQLSQPPESAFAFAASAPAPPAPPEDVAMELRLAGLAEEEATTGLEPTPEPSSAAAPPPPPPAEELEQDALLLEAATLRAELAHEQRRARRAEERVQALEEELRALRSERKRARSAGSGATSDYGDDGVAAVAAAAAAPGGDADEGVSALDDFASPQRRARVAPPLGPETPFALRKAPAPEAKRRLLIDDDDPHPQSEPSFPEADGGGARASPASVVCDSGGEDGWNAVLSQETELTSSLRHPE